MRRERAFASEINLEGVFLAKKLGSCLVGWWVFCQKNQLSLFFLFWFWFCFAGCRNLVEIILQISPCAVLVSAFLLLLSPCLANSSFSICLFSGLGLVSIEGASHQHPTPNNNSVTRREKHKGCSGHQRTW